MPTEIVRLPVHEGGADALLSYLGGHAYFEQEGLRAHRALRGVDKPEVALVLDWDSREAGHAALSSSVGKAFVEGLDPLLAGAPELGYYDAQD